jgi:hypothetical protein
MAEPKTKVNDASVEDFINATGDEKVIADCNTIIKMMQKASGEPPKMWGDAIVGFGLYTYKYSSGTTGDWPRLAFSPRKANLTLYLMPGFERMQDILQRLGKHKTSKACLYIKRISDVDLNVLKELIDWSLKEINEMYPLK